MGENVALGDGPAYAEEEISASPSLSEPEYGMLVFQLGQIVFSNHEAAEILGYSRDESFQISLDSLPTHIQQEDRARFMDLLESVKSGALAPILPAIGIVRRDGSHHRVDILINQTKYQGESAVQVHFLDNTPSPQPDEILPRQQDEVMRDVMAALA